MKKKLTLLFHFSKPRFRTTNISFTPQAKKKLKLLLALRPEALESHWSWFLKKVMVIWIGNQMAQPPTSLLLWFSNFLFEFFINYFFHFSLKFNPPESDSRVILCEDSDFALSVFLSVLLDSETHAPPLPQIRASVSPLRCPSFPSLAASTFLFRAKGGLPDNTTVFPTFRYLILESLLFKANFEVKYLQIVKQNTFWEATMN